MQDFCHSTSGIARTGQILGSLQSRELLKASGVAGQRGREAMPEIGKYPCFSSDAAPKPFNIAVCGLDGLAADCRVGASHVVSLLDPEAPLPLPLRIIGRCDRLVLRFHDVIAAAPGMTAPSPEQIERLLAFAAPLMQQPPRRLIIHCRAGVSRAPAAVALILAQAAAHLPASALADELLALRPCAWPNLRIIEIGDRLLQRDGAIIEAARLVYRARLARRPELARLMMRLGRAREVAAAR
jgi:predicted protein tyrosine phosphatase